MKKTKRERALELEAKIQEMQNLRKLLLQQAGEEERKARTRRICARGGMLEGMVPDTVKLSDDQLRRFFELTLTTAYARDKLAEALKYKPAPKTTLPAQGSANAALPGTAATS